MSRRRTHAPDIPLCLVLSVKASDDAHKTLKALHQHGLLHQIARMQLITTITSHPPDAFIQFISGPLLEALFGADRMRTLTLMCFNDQDALGYIADSIRSRDSDAAIWSDMEQLIIDCFSPKPRFRLRDVWDILAAAPAVAHLAFTTRHGSRITNTFFNQVGTLAPLPALKSVRGGWDVLIAAAIAAHGLERIDLWEKAHAHHLQHPDPGSSHPGSLQHVTSFTEHHHFMPRDWLIKLKEPMIRLRDIQLPLNMESADGENELFLALMDIPPTGGCLRSITIAPESYSENEDLTTEVAITLRILSRIEQIGDGRLRGLRQLRFSPQDRFSEHAVNFEERATIFGALKQWIKSRRVSLQVI